ncbi:MULTISPECIES: potassium channel family protein [Allobacillus]|uniref:Two pore domain potassium channel family protein n=1 Tax=Allobacillus salarius TaxID=1955272 RepID=A0A556PKT3_9BACI|nr:potassium channel family protein [Allobacillus salarius]TSJ64979.1 two pore domain potassium channel family protein [Allobacillus salarius]
MTTILIVTASLVVVVNLFYFFTNKSYNKSYFHLALFLKLFFVLAVLTVAFALLYYAIGLERVSLRHSDSNGDPVEPTFWNMLYYSGVTMLSVGYGDYVPVGISRFFSLIQASLGFLLPTAYFLTALGQKESK